MSFSYERMGTKTSSFEKETKGVQKWPIENVKFKVIPQYCSAHPLARARTQRKRFAAS